MTVSKTVVLVLQCAAWLLPVSAAAQPSVDRLELGVGVRRAGAMSLGAATASQTTGQGSAFALFTAQSELGGANQVEGRMGVRLSDTIHAEASASYGRSDLSTRLASDVEGIPDVTATESVQQYVVEGSVRFDLLRWLLGTRTTPFVAGGGGYARYRHEGRTLVESGGSWHLGGGANVVLRSRPDARLKAFGIRADARVVFRIGGIAFDDDPHAVPSLGVSAFLRF